MKSSKWIFGLMAMVLILAFSSASFAQVQIQLFNTASAGEIKTSRNINTSDPTATGSGILVSGQLIAQSPLTTTNLVLTFPGPITSNGLTRNDLGQGPGASTPAVDPIRIEGSTGLFANITAITTINFAAGTVTITLPCASTFASLGTQCGAANNNQSGSFRLVGVRVDANGKTAPLTVSTALSSSANNYIPPSSPTLNLVAALTDGIGAMAVGAVTGTSSGSFLVFSNQQTAATFADPNATIILTEGFASAWRTTTQATTSTTALANGTNIRLTINGLPSGFTVTITSVGSSSSRPGVNLPAAVTLTASSTTPSPSTTISFTSTSLTAVETLQLQLVLGGSTTSTLTASNITVTATMAPIGDTFLTTTATTSNNPPIETNGYPVFAQSDVGPLTIGSIAPANTTLLISYAVKVGAYDTGIAIANTSKDPFGANSGGATPSNGTITFTLYPRTDNGVGTEKTVTTSATVRPGLGLDANGMLLAGGTWTGSVTDLLTASATTGDFFGYIFVQTNFVLAHGAAYIFDGRGFTSATPVLVLPPPASTARAGIEALNN